jgi:hypothetical protein
MPSVSTTSVNLQSNHRFMREKSGDEGALVFACCEDVPAQGDTAAAETAVAGTSSH